MKRLKMGVLLLISCLFLTACGCSREEFIVAFDSNGGTEIQSQTVEKGGKATKPIDPTKEGYTFVGWYVDLEDENKYDFNNEVTSDLTLEAKWVTSSSGDTDKKVCNLTCEDGYELINGDSADCECVKKEVAVSSVKLSKSTLSLTVGGSSTVTATINPSDADDKTVTWKSSDEKVATVKNGKITAVAAGSATITATAGGKSATVKVTVISKDQANLTQALNTIKAKEIKKGNTNINFTYSGCTITNTSNTATENKTVVIPGLVKTLYRSTKAGSISSTYKVTCGSLSQTKTVKHTVPASEYTYIAVNALMLHNILIEDATNYTASIADGSVANLKYIASIQGFQTGAHVSGNIYDIVFNNDANTIYAVKSAK